MAAYKTFEELPIWQDSRSFVKDIYNISNTGTFARDRGLRDQIQRAAVSTMANIAEGFVRKTPRNFCQFLNYSKASAGETRSLLYVAKNVGHINESTFETLKATAKNLSRSLAGFIKYLKSIG